LKTIQGPSRLRQQRDHDQLSKQLKQAFPFPASGKFEDLLSAIDDAAKLVMPEGEGR